MRKQRKHYTVEEKVAVLRLNEPVSKLCDQLVLYRQNGAAAFQTKNRSSRQPERERIARLEKKIRTKDEVLVELMAEHIALKKSLGEL